MNFMRAVLPSHDIAGRMIPCFIDAGLPEPRVLWESVVPGSDTKWCVRWSRAMRHSYRPWSGSVWSTLGSATPRPCTTGYCQQQRLPARRVRPLRSPAHGRSVLSIMAETSKLEAKSSCAKGSARRGRRRS
jgi:hypothetical protein